MNWSDRSMFGPNYPQFMRDLWESGVLVVEHQSPSRNTNRIAALDCCTGLLHRIAAPDCCTEWLPGDESHFVDQSAGVEPSQLDGSIDRGQGVEVGLWDGGFA